jgi:hypothetical protein
MGSPGGLTRWFKIGFFKEFEVARKIYAVGEPITGEQLSNIFVTDAIQKYSKSFIIKRHGSDIQIEIEILMQVQMLLQMVSTVRYLSVHY